jgi:hypothetical protein
MGTVLNNPEDFILAIGLVNGDTVELWYARTSPKKAKCEGDQRGLYSR